MHMPSMFGARRPRRGVLLFATLAALASCGGHQEAEDEVAPDPQGPTELTVSNQHWLDVVVFIFHDGEMSRVGTVTGSTSQSFVLPAWMLGQTRTVRFLADPVGSNGWIRSDAVHVQPGQFIEWRLESELRRSTLAVY